MTAYLAPEQAARLRQAERRWLAYCAARLRHATTRRPLRAGGGKEVER